MARAVGWLRRAAPPGGPRLTGRAGSADDGDGGAAGRPDTVLQGGRRKAYRPRPAAERASALAAALTAYEAGDYFEAHELLEPAWMGTADELERELYQGLIKLAAAGVHQVRGNPAGMVNNLRGARQRLARVVDGGGADAGLDLTALTASIDERLEILAGLPPVAPRVPGSPRFAFRPPVAIKAPKLPRRAG